MPKPGDFILAHLVEPLPTGAKFERTRGAWPLHITLATWFSCNDVKGLRKKLSGLASNSQPFIASVGEEALFGPYNDVPVNVIANQADITELHELLVQAVRASGGEFEPAAWIEKGYQAHITHHGEHRRQSGDKETIADFHLVRLLPPNTCEVIARYRLGVSNETAA